MQKMDYFQTNKHVISKSPTKKTKNSKIAAFFPNTISPNKKQRGDIPDEKLNSIDDSPIILPSHPRSKYSLYQKFMCSVDKDLSVQRLFSQNRLKITEATKLNNFSSDTQRPQFQNVPPILLPKVMIQRNSMHSNSSYDRSSIINNLKAFDSNKEQTCETINQPHPKNDFYLGRLKPVRVGPLDSKDQTCLFPDSKSPSRSTRDKKNTKNFFSQPSMKNQQPDEDNFTIKLRKSLITFQHKPQIQKPGVQKKEIIIPNKITRASSQYSYQLLSGKKQDKSEQNKKSQSEERIKVVDIFQERKPKLQQVAPREKTQTEHQPSMVERNLQKKITLPKRQQLDTEIQTSQSIHQQSNFFSQEKSFVPSRLRIFSTKSPVKTPLIQQHFAPSRETTKLNDSKDIIYNLQQKLQGPYRSNNAYAINDSESIIKFSPQKNQPNSNSTQTNSNLIGRSENPAQYFSEQPIIMPVFSQIKYKIKPISYHEKDNLKFNDYQVFNSNKSPDTVTSIPSTDKKEQRIFTYSNFNHRPETVRNDRILDLLLLSTCELKSYFRQDYSEQLNKNQVKKVKVVQSKQRFPGDFFNV